MNEVKNLGRPVKNKADLLAIRKLSRLNNDVIDLKSVIAYVMYKSGCSYAEIGRVFAVTRQYAKQMVDTFEEKL
jgi:hypothetical protein